MKVLITKNEEMDAIITSSDFRGASRGDLLHCLGELEILKKRIVSKIEKN